MSFQVIASAPYWSLNGVNTFTAELLSGLAAQGVPGRVLLTDPDPFRRLPMPVPEGLVFERLPVRPEDSLSSRRRIFQEWLEARSPCIYLPNYDYAYSCLSPRLSEKVKILGIVHSDDPEHYEHVNRLGAYWDSVICVSEAILRKVLAEGRVEASRVKKIAYGVTIPETRMPRPGGRRPLRILYAGRMAEYQKRTGDLFKIAREMRRRKIPCEWTLAGDGIDRAALERKFEGLRGQGVRSDFTGTVSRADLYRLYEAHDVFILASGFEGLPLALLEAMGCGCVPVAARTESGIPEVIAEGLNGWSVPIGGIGAFADKLEILFHDPGIRAAMSAEAHRTILADFSQKRMVSEYADVCRTLAAQNAPPPGRNVSSEILPPPLFPRDPARAASFLKTGTLFASHWIQKKLKPVLSGRDFKGN